MNIFIIGATGFVGSAVSVELISHGHVVHGLARSPGSRDRIEAAGMRPVDGDLADTADLLPKLQPFDVVILIAGLAFEDELVAVRELIAGSRGREQRIIFTSGTGVLSIAAEAGQWCEQSFAEDDPFPFPARRNRAVRLQTERLVREANGNGLITNVIRPPLIWGHAQGGQVTRVFQSAKERGAAWYIGDGLNLYSNVHVDDLARLFRLVAEGGVPGALYQAVAGEANFRTIAEAVADVIGCGTRSVTYAQACELWGQTTVDLAHAVNSRSRSPRSRQELGWAPERCDLIAEIRDGSYARHHSPTTRRNG